MHVPWPLCVFMVGEENKEEGRRNRRACSWQTNQVLLGETWTKPLTWNVVRVNCKAASATHGGVNFSR